MRTIAVAAPFVLGAGSTPARPVSPFFVGAEVRSAPMIRSVSHGPAASIASAAGATLIAWIAPVVYELRMGDRFVIAGRPIYVAEPPPLRRHRAVR